MLWVCVRRIPQKPIERNIFCEGSEGLLPDMTYSTIDICNNPYAPWDWNISTFLPEMLTIHVDKYTSPLDYIGNTYTIMAGQPTPHSRTPQK